MNVLITSMFSTYGHVISSVVNFRVSKVYLVVQEKDRANPEDPPHIKEAYKKFREAKKLIEKSLHKSGIEVNFVFFKDNYDLYDITTKVIDIIDSLNSKDKIYINATGGRKTVFLSLQLAAYSRSKKIEKVFYVTEEGNKIIYMPLMSFSFTDSERNVLNEIKDISEKGSSLVISNLAEKVQLSRAMVYRILIDLEKRGFIEDCDGYLKITTIGKIALY